MHQEEAAQAKTYKYCQIEYIIIPQISSQSDKTQPLAHLFMHKARIVLLSHRCISPFMIGFTHHFICKQPAEAVRFCCRSLYHIIFSTLWRTLLMSAYHSPRLPGPLGCRSPHTYSCGTLLVNAPCYKNWLLISAFLTTKQTSYMDQSVPYLCFQEDTRLLVFSEVKFDFSSTSTLNQNHCSHIKAYNSFQLKLAYFWTTAWMYPSLAMEFHFVSAGHFQLLSVIRLLQINSLLEHQTLEKYCSTK